MTPIRTPQSPSRLSQIEPDTTLCLACSSSLPPYRKVSEFGESLEAYRTRWAEYLLDQGFYITPCCSRPICPRCIQNNARLARYDPCLACLGGVEAVGHSNSSNGQKDSKSSTRQPDIKNIDGALKDEDVFSVGIEDDEIDGAIMPPPPLYTPTVGEGLPPPVSPPPEVGDEQRQWEDILPPSHETNPTKYYLEKRDTLQGIALRYRLDGRELCRLNNLPTSVLTTTPHLLHTRSHLTLPPHIMPPSQGRKRDDANETELEARRLRERAERRLQMLTKETDWGVARAYVALADSEEVRDEHRRKMKEITTGQAGQLGTSLEAVAIEQYLDDEEWEANERRSGRMQAPWRRG